MHHSDNQPKARVKSKKPSKITILKQAEFLGCYAEKNGSSVETRVMKSLKKKLKNRFLP